MYSLNSMNPYNFVSNHSSSTSSTSLYETPIHSPSAHSLDSTSLDMPFSLESQTMPFRDERITVSYDDDARQSLSSAASTLTAQYERTQSNVMPQSVNSTDVTHKPYLKSIAQSADNLSKNCDFDAHSREEKFNILYRYLKDVEKDQMQMIGMEQQMQMMSFHCKSIHENTASKLSAIYSLLNDLSPQKCDVQTQTVNDESGKTQPKQRRVISKIDSVSISKIPFHSPIIEVKTPIKRSKRLSPSDENVLIKDKFNRLPALVKGYLTRRLMRTEKVEFTLKLIRDTTLLLQNFRSDSSHRVITEEDIKFHSRLMAQLNRAINDFYDIFFNYSKKAQMKLIANSRQLYVERHFRSSSSMSASTMTSPTQLSAATIKALQRKFSIESNQNKTAKIKSPIKKDIHTKHVPKSGSKHSTSTIASKGTVSINAQNAPRRSQRNNIRIKSPMKKSSLKQ